MKYSDVINFSTIETVIEIREAEDKQKARNLVESYVMSDEMADKFGYGIIQQLQFVEAVDNKGVLVVGNYGTGKSHLMSVISSVAQDETNIQYLRNKKFAEHASNIAGQFEVLRIEIGAVKSSLRDIICREIEMDFEKRGINYSFPSIDTITNNKSALLKMMSLFQDKYPDKGYLIVIDELLDYLRARKEHALGLDLGFLREVGEIIKNTRLRLICGIQEQLFENPRFSFVANALNRVKDRFDQVIIRKEDTAYVVSERILSKTSKQKALIREHLQPFCNLYSEMSERLEDYVELYPIHPAYLDIFHKVSVAEKREVLKTISLSIKKILNDDVPVNQPGILSYDSYWSFIKDNYARKAETDIKEVMDKSAVLEDKITRSFPKPAYKSIALQIINALSVHRLATGGINVRIGITAENMKDDLCLFLPMPEMESEFLLSVVKTVLKEIIQLVSGQFIECNKDNGQYFLDLKKDIDYDAKISQKAEALDADTLNRYYFKIVYDSLDWEAKQYVSGFEIYEYNLNWNSKNIYRRGYLFMGPPNGRSTAQPPRDYYIYFISPYGDVDYKDEVKADEVLFIFKGDITFEENLKFYAAALSMRELASESSTKGIYNQKANVYRKALQKWLNNNKNTCYDVVYKGVKKQLIEITTGKTVKEGFKDTIDITASICLDEYFNSIYPKFPTFQRKITQANQADTMKRALEYFAGKVTQDSRDYLNSLGLINNGKIDISYSMFAMMIKKQLDKLPAQGVLNRSDLVEERASFDYFKSVNVDFYYIMPVLVALVYTGNAVVCLSDNTKLTASNINVIQRNGTYNLLGFKYITKPKEAAVKELAKLFEIFNLPSGLLVNPKQKENGLRQLSEKMQNLASEALKAKSKLNENFTLWGELLIPENIMRTYKDTIAFVLDESNNFKNKYNTVAKLNNFNLSLQQLDEFEKGMEYINIINEYSSLKSNLESSINYINNIYTLELPQKMTDDIKAVKELYLSIRDSIREDGNTANSIESNIGNKLSNIKKTYIDYYFEKHNKCRLGAHDQDKKTKLINSKYFSNLRKLSNIDSIFSSAKLTSITNELAGLKTCFDLTSKDMESSYICPHCHFKLDDRDNITTDGRLDDIEYRVEELYKEWTTILLNTVDDPLTLANKEFLKPRQRAMVDNLLETKELTEIIDTFFVDTINTLISEIDKVEVSADELIDTITKLGPREIEDFKKQILTFIDQKVKGKDASKLRIILKKEEQ